MCTRPVLNLLFVVRTISNGSRTRCIATSRANAQPASMTHIEVTAKNSRHVQIAVERHIEIENKRGFTARGRMLQRQARRVVFSSDALIRNCVLPYASCICIL